MDGLVFKNSLPDRQAFYGLFITTGWNNKYQLSEDELYEALEKSWFCLSVYKSDQLVDLAGLSVMVGSCVDIGFDHPSGLSE